MLKVDKNPELLVVNGAKPDALLAYIQSTVLGA